MLEFFNRPVFNRCWVIQKVVVGQKVTVRCGKYTIDWADRSRIAQTFAQRPWVEKLPHHSVTKGDGLLSLSTNLEGKDVKQAGSLNVVTMNGLREDFQTVKENPLESLLYTTSLFQESDPRDNIYSVLGIQSAKEPRKRTPQTQRDRAGLPEAGGGSVP